MSTRLRRESLELPLLKSLVELGGSAAPDERLYRLVAERAGISEDPEYDIVHARPKWVYDLQWVRHTLVKQSEIDGSVRGVWQITDLGRDRVSREWDAYRAGDVVPVKPGRKPASPVPQPVSVHDQATEWMDEYYRNRSERLRVAGLNDLLPFINPYALCLESIGEGHAVVEHALDAYLALTEQSIFGDVLTGRKPRNEDWQELTGDADFYLKLIRAMEEYPTAHRRKYDREYAKAVNRFTKEFLNEFSSEDGTIDWEKLVRFNSGADGGKD